MLIHQYLYANSSMLMLCMFIVHHTRYIKLSEIYLIHYCAKYFTNAINLFATNTYPWNKIYHIFIILLLACYWIDLKFLLKLIDLLPNDIEMINICNMFLSLRCIISGIIIIFYTIRIYLSDFDMKYCRQ